MLVGQTVAGTECDDVNNCDYDLTGAFLRRTYGQNSIKPRVKASKFFTGGGVFCPLDVRARDACQVLAWPPVLTPPLSSDPIRIVEIQCWVYQAQDSFVWFKQTPYLTPICVVVAQAQDSFVWFKQTPYLTPGTVT